MRSRSIALVILACLVASGGLTSAAESADEQAKRVTRMGFSLGTPSALNFVATSDLSWSTISLSGMYWGAGPDGIRGVQVGTSIVRSRRTRNFRSLNLIAGISDVDEKSWTYAGVEGHFSWSSFFLQPGLTFGSGDYSSPQASVQLGFAWSL